MGVWLARRRIDEGNDRARSRSRRESLGNVWHPLCAGKSVPLHGAGFGMTLGASVTGATASCYRVDALVQPPGATRGVPCTSVPCTSPEAAATVEFDATMLTSRLEMDEAAVRALATSCCSVNEPMCVETVAIGIAKRPTGRPRHARSPARGAPEGPQDDPRTARRPPPSLPGLRLARTRKVRLPRWRVKRSQDRSRWRVVPMRASLAAPARSRVDGGVGGEEKGRGRRSGELASTSRRTQLYSRPGAAYLDAGTPSSRSKLLHPLTAPARDSPGPLGASAGPRLSALRGSANMRTCHDGNALLGVGAYGQLRGDRRRATRFACVVCAAEESSRIAIALAKARSAASARFSHRPARRPAAPLPRPPC